MASLSTRSRAKPSIASAPAMPASSSGTWPDASADDVRAAIAAARRAFDTGPWPRMSGAERSRLMFKTAELILANVEEIALIESLEVGKPIAQARGEITFCADLWSYAAGQAVRWKARPTTIRRQSSGPRVEEPVGVVGIITPWNFPFIIASERVPWAIGGGCTVVLKPSEFTSGTSIRMAGTGARGRYSPTVSSMSSPVMAIRRARSWRKIRAPI